MAKGICKVEGCTSFIHARGLCGKHSYRQDRYGSPHETVRSPDREKIESKLYRYTKNSDAGCILWTGAINNRGYGIVWDSERKKSLPAHCRAYELHVGPVPEGTELAHLCGNKSCVNPQHLQAMSHEKHMQMDKGKTKHRTSKGDS